MKPLKIILSTVLIGAALVGCSMHYSNANERTAVGKFDGTFIDVDGNEYYHFKSNDDKVWWSLTAREMGFVPKANTEYALTYDNKGTTECDCDPKYDCECAVYDDEFISISEVQ